MFGNNVEFNDLWFQADCEFTRCRRLLFDDPRWTYGPLYVRDTVEPLISMMGQRIVGASCCDLGCGVSNVVGNSALLYLNGAEENYAFDILQSRDMARSAEALYDLLVACSLHPDEYHLAGHFPRSEFLARIRRFDIKALRSGDLLTGISDVHLKYEVRSVFDLPENLGPFDLIFSRAVLEHIPDLKQSLVEMHKRTSLNGVHRHLIDFVDHRSYKSNNFHPWSFLAEDENWFVGVPSGDVSNRLRPSEVEEIFRDVGFGVKVVGATHQSMPDHVYDSITEQFRRFPRQELETTIMTIEATKLPST